MDPIRNSSSPNTHNTYTMNSDNKNTTFTFKNLDKISHQNLMFDSRDNIWYKNFNRFGWINELEYDTPVREYVFFTRPDLYIFDDTDGTKLNDSLRASPFFKDAFYRHRDALRELQYSTKAPNGTRDRFMHYLSNNIGSKLDLPAIASESAKSTPNVYGLSIDYRSNSIKSDYAFDFSLTFKDNSRLDIYTMIKAYDEYTRLMRMGEIDFGIGKTGNSIQNQFKKYIMQRIIPEQFSIYKFIVGSDGETLLYWAKATGVYFTDVPRADFSDPPQDGFKFSVSFHANFVEDMNPAILSEFDTLTLASDNYYDFLPVHDELGINNEPAEYARIISVRGSRRATRRAKNNQKFFDYLIKWTNKMKDYR